MMIVMEDMKLGCCTYEYFKFIEYIFTDDDDDDDVNYDDVGYDDKIDDLIKHMYIFMYIHVVLFSLFP